MTSTLPLLWSLAVAPAVGDAAPPPPEVTPEPAQAAVGARLTVQPGRTCLTHERLAEQVEHWLGRAEIDPRLSIEVTGADGDPRAVLVTLRDRSVAIAERPFEALPSDCADAHTAVGLAIALAIDATVLDAIGIPQQPDSPVPVPPGSTSDVEVRPRPTPPRATAEPTPTKVEPTPTPAPPRMAVRGRLGGIFTVGTPPGLGGGGEVGVELGWLDLVDLQMGVLAATSGRRTIDAEAGTSLAATFVAGRTDVCTGPRLGRVRPRACVGVLAGAAIASGRGFSVDRTVTLPWVALTLSADVRVRLTKRLSLEFGADGLVSVVQPGLDAQTAAGTEPVRDFARFGVAAGAGLVVGFR